MDERQIRLLVVLSAATLAVGLVYLLAPRRTVDPPWDEQATVEIWELEPDQIVGLRVEPASGPILDARKVDEGWQLREPVQQEADEVRIEAALEALTRIDKGVPLSDGDGPEALGLGELPKARITLTLTNGRSVTLDVGNAAPVGWQTYAKAPSGELVAVRGQLDQDVLIDARLFRDAHVFDFDVSKFDAVVLQSPQGVLEVTRDEGDLFWLEGYGRADPQATENLVLEAYNLRLDGFMDGVAPEGISAPEYSLTLRQRDGVVHTARFGEVLPMGRLVQTAVGTTGTINPERLAFLRQGPTDLLDKRAFPIRSERVERIAVSIDGRSTEIVGREGNWAARGVPQEQVQSLYRGVYAAGIDLEASDLPDNLPGSTGRVQAWLGADQVRIVELGPVRGDVRLARDVSGGGVYAVKEADIQAIAALLPEG